MTKEQSREIVYGMPTRMAGQTSERGDPAQKAEFEKGHKH